MDGKEARTSFWARRARGDMRYKKQWVRACVAGLLGIMAVLAVLSMKDASATIDEVIHIPAGYSYLTFQEYRLNPEHPPLIKDIAALPLLFLDLQIPEGDSSGGSNIKDQSAFGQLFLYGLGNNPDEILFWARLPMIGLLLLFGLFLFHWARELGGTSVGLGVLALFAFSPTFLAHGRLVTTDVGAALGIVVATYWYLKFLYQPSFLRAVFVSLFLSIALLFKFSTFVLVPYFIILAVLYLVFLPRNIPKTPIVLRYVFFSLLIGLLVVVFITIIYSVHVLNYPVEQQARDAKLNLSWFYGVDPESISFEMPENSVLRSLGQYLLGLVLIFARINHDQLRYFLGELHWSRDLWYYFPVLYLVKVPLAFHVFTMIALGYSLSLKNRFQRLLKDGVIQRWPFEHFTQVAMASFVFLYIVIAMQSSLAIGVRHLLPIFPFLYILVVLGVQKWFLEARFPPLAFRASILAGLMGWYIFSSVSAFPHYLSYYNELAGGIENGYKVAVDSNYDWGQDLKRLKWWVDSQDLDKIYVDYFGLREGTIRSYLQEAYIPWKGASRWGENRVNPANFPSGNYLAVSATLLQGGRWDKETQTFERDYVWLDAYEPVDRAGYSIFIYYID